MDYSKGIAWDGGHIYDRGRCIWDLPEGETVQQVGLLVTADSGAVFYMDLVNRIPVLVELPWNKAKVTLT